MDICNTIREAERSYISHCSLCDNAAVEAQEYIDWDDFVSCMYFPSDGLCILATMPEEFSSDDLSDRVCPAEKFFEFAKGRDKISPEEFKNMSI